MTLNPLKSLVALAMASLRGTHRPIHESHGRDGRQVLLWVLMLLTVLLGSPAWAQEPAQPLGEPDWLRAEIDRLEEQADYAGMILAADDLERAARSKDDRVFALRSRGRAYALLSDYEQALEFMNRALSVVELDIANIQFAEIYRDTAGLLGEMGRYEQSLELIERGLAVIEDEDRSELRANLLIMKGSMQGVLGQLDEALETIESALTLPLATEREAVMRLNNYGMVLKWRNEHQQALEVFEDVLTRALEMEQEQIIVYGLLEVGDVNRFLGNPDVARTHLEDALARSLAADQPRWLIFTYNYLAELEASLGRSSEAQDYRDRLTEIETERRNKAAEDQATVLEVNMELLEREKRIDRLRLESELQALRLDRSRKLTWLTGVAAVLLLIALWLAIQQVRVRSAANRRLDRLANTDTLTGLFNRRYVIKRAEAELVESGTEGPMGLILIDLDRFKRINDDHGHEQGDAVLVEVARRIQGVMRDRDVVARWGGEEYLALLPGCDSSTAERVAHRILESLTVKAIHHEGHRHVVTATIGVAFAQQGEAFDAALQRADLALYRGKEKGRNRVEVAS